MHCRRTAMFALLSTAVFSGCAGHSDTTTTTATVTQRADPHPPLEIDRIIQDVIGAPDSQTEAEDLARLHNWMADHVMTYHVMVENAETHDRAPAAAESRYPLRVTLEIYKGQDVFRTFQFVPRDNRNLTQLGLN